MGLLDGQLLKMLILSFNTDSNGNKSGLPIPYPVMYNPENFTKNVRTVLRPRRVTGDTGEEQEYGGNAADSVSFEFLFDATGGSVNSINGEVAKALGGVDAEIELFLFLTSARDPLSHQSRKLTLVWGTFIFDCRLESASINYTLFSSIGRPIRAKVNATFKGDRLRLLQAAFDKLFSADLTHVHIVKSGETLPLIAKNIYDDPLLYIEIARINNLKNFRSIKPGMELILPPVNKREN